MSWPIKRNDLDPAYTGTLLIGGQPADLTGKTVKFIMTNTKTGVVKVEAAASIVGNPTEGSVQYAWVLGDTDTSGLFKAEWEVNIAGRPRTFPARSYLFIEISDDLA